MISVFGDCILCYIPGILNIALRFQKLSKDIPAMCMGCSGAKVTITITIIEGIFSCPSYVLTVSKISSATDFAHDVTLIMVSSKAE